MDLFDRLKAKNQNSAQIHQSQNLQKKLGSPNQIELFTMESHHFKTVTSINEKQCQVSNFCTINHAIDIIRALHKL